MEIYIKITGLGIYKLHSLTIQEKYITCSETVYGNTVHTMVFAVHIHIILI